MEVCVSNIESQAKANIGFLLVLEGAGEDWGEGKRTIRVSEDG